MEHIRVLSHFLLGCFYVLFYGHGDFLWGVAFGTLFSFLYSRSDGSWIWALVWTLTDFGLLLGVRSLCCSLL